MNTQLSSKDPKLDAIRAAFVAASIAHGGPTAVSSLHRYSTGLNVHKLLGVPSLADATAQPQPWPVPPIRASAADLARARAMANAPDGSPDGWLVTLQRLVESTLEPERDGERAVLETRLPRLVPVVARRIAALVAGAARAEPLIVDGVTIPHVTIDDLLPCLMRMAGDPARPRTIAELRWAHVASLLVPPDALDQAPQRGRRPISKRKGRRRSHG